MRLSPCASGALLIADPTQAAVPRAQTQRRLQPRRRRHTGDDHEGQRRPGIPFGGVTWREAHASAGRVREGSGTDVLCGGDSATRMLTITVSGS